MFCVNKGSSRRSHQWGEVTMTIEAGTHDWNDPSRQPERAVRIRVDRGGKYDAISSSIIPVWALPEVLEVALYRGADEPA